MKNKQERKEKDELEETKKLVEGRTSLGVSSSIQFLKGRCEAKNRFSFFLLSMIVHGNKELNSLHSDTMAGHSQPG